MIANVGLAVIGDEVLLGEVTEKNIALISRELFGLGADLRYACVLPDDRDFLGVHLNWMKDQFQWVITTGGIGATHDDLTREVIADLFGVRLVEHPGAVAALEAKFGGPLPERLRPLTVFPEGAVLIENPLTAAPGFRFDTFLVLPGIPALVEGMLPFLAGVITGETTYREQILTMKYESEIAPILKEAQDRHPGVKIGSYPVLAAEDHRVRIVLRGRDRDKVALAGRFLKEKMG